MKKFFSILLCTLFIYSAFSPTLGFSADEQPNRCINHLTDSMELLYKKNPYATRIMTYNVLSDGLGFDGMSVETRDDDLLRLIKTISPDVLSLQEVNVNWYKSLLNKAFLYKFICPLNYALSFSMTTILYNTETTELIDWGSEAYTCSNDSRLRSYTWGVFLQKNTGFKFIVINTHLSMFEKNADLPINQASELTDFCNTIKNLYSYPIYVTGDFNTKVRTEDSENSAVYEYLNLFFNNALDISSNVSWGTSTDVNTCPNDYIFTTDDTNIINYVLLSQPYLNVISDHFPVFIDILET